MYLPRKCTYANATALSKVTVRWQSQLLTQLVIYVCILVISNICIIYMFPTVVQIRGYW